MFELLSISFERYKSVAKTRLGAYPQMPYEAIDEKTYQKQVSKLGKLSFGVIKHEEAEVDKFCNNDSCEIVPLTGDNDDQDYAN